MNSCLVGIIIVPSRETDIVPDYKSSNDMAELEGASSGDNPRPVQVYKVCLSEIDGTLIDLNHLTPLRYRLIDCSQFINDQVLAIVEVNNIDTVQYSALSYVWAGLKADASTLANGTFNVCGAGDSDPISVQVLVQVCKLALKENTPWLWLDRISVLQTSRDDKDWQIKRMHDIYQASHCCIVLTAGLGMLATLEQPADGDWIHRSWTFQEAVVTRKALCLYASTLGDGYLYGNPRNLANETPGARYQQKEAVNYDLNLTHIAVESIGGGQSKSFIVPRDDENYWWTKSWPSVMTTDVFELEKGECAASKSTYLSDSPPGVSVYVGLADLLAVNGADQSWPLVFDARFHSDKKFVPLTPSCFSWTRCGSARALFQMLACRDRVNDAGKPYWQTREVHRMNSLLEKKLPGFTAEAVHGQNTTSQSMTPEDLEVAAYCVWVSLSKRTTSRPVDAVFSVMNMLNISLDPKDFRDLKFPRLAATVKLAQEYLRKGGRAWWLCLFFAQGRSAGTPCLDQRMCTMMQISEPGQLENVSDFVSRADVESPTPIVAGCPAGSMDDQGYLKIEVPTLELAAGEVLIVPHAPSKVFKMDVKVIYVGTSIGSKNASQGYFDEFFHYLVLAEHLPGRWHIVVSFTTEQEYEGTFSARTVEVGGPCPASKLFESGTTFQVGERKLSAESYVRLMNKLSRSAGGLVE